MQPDQKRLFCSFRGVTEKHFATFRSINKKRNWVQRWRVLAINTTFTATEERMPAEKH